MTSTLDDCCGYELIKSGTTSINVLFNTVVPAQGITMIAIGEFDRLMEIDQTRSVLIDGSV
jgi:hypothetical protein